MAVTTTTSFLAQLQRLIISPSNQSLFNVEDFLAVGDRKMTDTIVPVIDSLNVDYFVRTEIMPLVSGQDEYRLPTRAAARKLREVKLINSSNIRFDFPKVSIEREQLYQISGVPFGFYLKGDRFVVVPSPSTTQWSVQYWYFLAPGRLVPESEAAVVQSFVGDDVTVVSVPPSIVIGSSVDFIQGTAGNSSYSLGKTVQNIAGTVLTFATGDVPVDLEVGDFISLAGTSPVLQIPDTAVPYFVTEVGKDILQASSDFEGYDRLDKMSKEQLTFVKTMLDPRVEGEATKVINNFGLVNRGWSRRFRGYYNF